VTAAPASLVAAPRPPAELPAEPLELLPGNAVVAVAMSGGVDSSVAAARCAARGLPTFGITLAMWPRGTQTARDRGCCSVDAVDDARRVCARLGIAHYAWNLEAEFRTAVIADFEDQYAAGRTPNPCVRCNSSVKFGTLLERARSVGATHVATGHYARIGRRGALWTLHRARTAAKDQAYTLHRLGQAQLGAAVFPLGGFTDKAEVRAEARRLGLATAGKPDSQELCFVEESIAAELERRLRGRYEPGPVVDLGGRLLGEHRGLPFYTVGQRSGLGVRPGRPDATPLHVLRLDRAANRLVVGPREALLSRRALARSCAWVAEEPAVGLRCGAQLRAHGAAVPATIEEIGEGSLRVRFDEPVTAIAPGQSLVLCAGDEVLGGGIVAVDEAA